MSKAIGSSLVLSLLALACGRIDEQPIGDTMGEGGSADASAPSGSGGKAVSVAGSAGTSANSGGKSNDNPGGEECGGEVCEPGSECFVQAGATNDAGVCVPLCNPAEPTDQTTYGLECAGAIGGGDGICRAFLRYVEFDTPVNAGGLTPTGICTNACDPLAQECPDGFSCDLTDTPQGSLASWSYACLPALTPLETGAACDGAPVGACMPGSTCVFDSTCAEFCDTEATDACPALQECAKPDWFPADSSAGVCVVP
jgi:hypothetical protein